MLLAPEEISEIKGKDLLGIYAVMFVKMDADIRFWQGRQAAPCPHELAKADLFHALALTLEFVIASGPNITVGKVITFLRKALEDATRTRGIKHGPGPDTDPADAQGAGDADQGAC